MPEDGLIIWEEKLLDKLEKEFPDDDITIIYVYIGPWNNETKRKQSLLINGEKIAFSWSPPLDKIETEDTFNTIYKMCVREIKNEKTKQK